MGIIAGQSVVCNPTSLTLSPSLLERGAGLLWLIMAYLPLAINGFFAVTSHLSLATRPRTTPPQHFYSSPPASKQFPMHRHDQTHP